MRDHLQDTMRRDVNYAESTEEPVYISQIPFWNSLAALHAVLTWYVGRNWLNAVSPLYDEWNLCKTEVEFSTLQWPFIVDAAGIAKLSQ